MLLLSDSDGQQLLRVQEENSHLRRELAGRERTIAELELRLQRAGLAPAGPAGLSAFGLAAGAEPMARAGSMPVHAVAGTASLPMPVAAPTSLPLPTLVSMPSGPAQQPQLVVPQQQLPVGSLAAQLAPGGMAQLQPAALAPALPGLGGVAQPALSVPEASAAAAAAAAAQQQVQALAGVQAGVQQQVMVGVAPAAPAAPQVLLQAASGAMPVAQPAATTLSGGALAAAAAGIQPAAPALTTLSNDALSGEAAAAAAAAAAAGMPLVPAATQPALSGEPGVADQAAQSLTHQAQQLTVQASLHGQAKTQLHAQASVQAAVEAEKLKQTLAVLPDTPAAQHTVATVQNLENKAKQHADITTQARRRREGGWPGAAGVQGVGGGPGSEVVCVQQGP